MADVIAPTPGTPTPDPTPTPTPVVKVDAIPYERFKEVNDALKALKTEKEQREEADRKAQEEKLLGEKKYEELLKQRDTENAALKKEREELSKYRQEQEDKEKSRREALLKEIEDKEDRSIAEKLPSSDDIAAFTARLKGRQEARNDPKGKTGDPKTGALSPIKGETSQQYQERMRKEFQRKK